MCKENCSGNCLNNETCYHIDGHCMKGCETGFQGEKCDALCPPGTFGEDCAGNCSGNCDNNDTCYFINGHCLWGCRDGFRGKRCDEQNSPVALTGSCIYGIDYVYGLTAGLVISFILNVGFLFTVIKLIRKKKNKQGTDHSTSEVNDREGFQQRSIPVSHVENHAYEELNATQSVHIYQNLSLNDNKTSFM
ncbi:multiple epidermal growth factor-like domains protein 10 [Saccostrea cucullata]|uniref:multiple epidermal growth factor-like domains protein 10 n=1 Tax=Saccostrea cuccullata TaxID=36930 RepID=UPI002ED11D51